MRTEFPDPPVVKQGVDKWCEVAGGRFHEDMVLKKTVYDSILSRRRANKAHQVQFHYRSYYFLHSEPDPTLFSG